MKIRVRDHAKFQADKMAKIALAATPRVLLDLYCAGARARPRSPTPTTTRTRSTWSSRAADASASAAPRRRWRRARPSWRRRALAHGVVNDGRPAAAPRARLAAASARVSPSPRVAFMVTCLGDLFYPEVGERIVRLLRRLGVTVEFPSGQTCCGLPLFNSGSP